MRIERIFSALPKILRVLAAVAGMNAMALLAIAQSTTGSIQGTVTGPDGAAIPGVNVTIRNNAISLSRSTTTNASGNYAAPLLPPGTYQISAEAAGFQRVQKTGIELEVNQNPRIDFTLPIGTVQESVTVQANAELIDTQDSEDRHMVLQKQVVDLPLNGRSFRNLGLIVPGVADMAQGSNLATRGGGMNVVGAQDTQNNFLLDGFDNNDPTTGESLTFPTVDSIQEFAIEGASYSADKGFAGGGIITLVTKSGSTSFHGDAWEFLRNDVLNGRNFFATTTPPLKRNQFGGSLGGPLQKGSAPRFFAFGAYEDTIYHLGVTQTATVPTADERNGNFSALSAKLVDPLTKQPLAGNQIPLSQINPVGLAMLKLYPLPTSGGLTQNYVSDPVTPNNLQVATARMDFSQSQSNSYFGRYSQYWQTTLNPRSPFVIGLGNLIKHNYNIGGEWTHVYGPATVQEIRVAFGHIDNENYAHDLTNYDPLLGITTGTIATVTPNAISGGPPAVTPTGYNAITGAGGFVRYHKLWQGAYALTHSVGNHAVKVGAEYRHYYMSLLDDTTPQGSFTFTGVYSGNAIADMLYGYPLQTQNLLGPTLDDEKSWQIAGYVQDTWRISHDLTLNLGFRYEFQTPDTSSNNLLGAFVPGIGKAVQAGTNGLPPGIFNNYYKNFAPRVGFAWDPFHKGTTSVRASYGVYNESRVHDLVQPTGYVSAPISAPGQFVASSVTPNISLSNPFPASLAATSLSTFGIDPSYHGGRTQRWELSLQKKLGAGFAEAAYVGSHTGGMASSYNLNQPLPGPGAVQSRRPFPNYSTITWYDGTGFANYQALQAKYEYRLLKGLSLLGAYTFGKSLDNQQEPGVSAATPNQDPLNRAADYGRSSFDVRQRLVVSLTYALQFRNIFLKDWQISTISTLSSGPPVTALLATDNANIGTTTNQRPNESGNPDSGAPNNAQQWFNTSVFSLPAQYTFGTGRKNDITAPGVESVDLALSRRFRFTETRLLEIRIECFDSLNHTNFQLPNVSAGTANFGKIFTANDPREFQLGAKLYF